MLSEVITHHLSNIQEVCGKYDISYMGVFGSYARGDETQDSDVDLLIEFAQSKSFFELMDLEEELEIILQKKVDLVIRKYLDRYIQPYVTKDLQSIYPMEPPS